MSFDWTGLGCVAAVLAGGVGLAGGADVSSNWYRDAAISPDGSTIVFCHGGDLYSVPSSGGRAFPLSIHEAYESRPVWSRDGSMIAFASDRSGNEDVYVMPSQGGAATRLTFHSADDTPTAFTADGSGVLFTSARVDAAESALFPSGVLAELYEVSLEGGTPRMVLTTPALNAQPSPDGSRILYEDRKGFENELRKHHTSSIARDIWVYDVASRGHTKLTADPHEDRHPVWAVDGKSLYFLSERGGDFNVYTMPAEAGGERSARALTGFEHHPVRGLSRANDGTLAFSWHGEIYTLSPEGETQRVDISILVDGDISEPRARTERSGATGFAVAPSGKEVAFVLRGEVFVTSVEFGTTRRITNTPEQERSVTFSPDGRSLVYASERDGSWNLYKSSMADENELYFFSSTRVDEEPVLATAADEFQPVYSPCGSKLAYLHERHEIRVLDLESGESVIALPGDMFYSYSDGDHHFAWSPDSRWLAVHFYTRGRVFYSEVGMVAADGSGDLIELSKSGYSDTTPQFAMDGGAVIWATDRFGERSHGSWGAEYDVMGAFLTQDAFDRFRLSKEEYELQKELEEKRKEDDEEPDEDEAVVDDADAEDSGKEAVNGETDESPEDEVEPMQVERDGLETRRARLTIHASDLAGFAMSPDGEKLFYLAGFEKGYDLWVHDFREESTKILTKLGASSASMVMSDDGEHLFMLVDGALAKVATADGKREGISFAATMMVDGDAERRHLFEHVYRQTKKKFYRPDMHGVDWAFYREQYLPKLDGVTNNRDFAVILSEFLGELNASHTGGRYFSGSKDGDAQTAALGVIFDQDHDGDGRLVAEVLDNGPLDKADLPIASGDLIVAVDGGRVTAGSNFYALLDGKVGDRVRITVRDADTGEESDHVVRPISTGAQDNLLYERWVRTRESIVEEASGGRLGYAHVRGMNDASFRAFYERVMGKHYDKEALVVDTRFNGGGWLHDDLATFLTGETYVNLYPRNDLAPGIRYHGDPSTRWVKPSVVVMSESNYSDAHFFPWVYTQLEIGDTVGMPVPGTATAVWWERLHTGDLVFGIPQVGTKGREGTYLENDQLEPTHKVNLDPNSAADGRDTQLLKAVEVLLEDLDRGD